MIHLTNSTLPTPIKLKMSKSMNIKEPSSKRRILGGNLTHGLLHMQRCWPNSRKVTNMPPDRSWMKMTNLEDPKEMFTTHSLVFLNLPEVWTSSNRSSLTRTPMWLFRSFLENVSSQSSNVIQGQDSDLTAATVTISSTPLLVRI